MTDTGINSPCKEDHYNTSRSECIFPCKKVIDCISNLNLELNICVAMVCEEAGHLCHKSDFKNIMLHTPINAQM